MWTPSNKQQNVGDLFYGFYKNPYLCDITDFLFRRKNRTKNPHTMITSRPKKLLYSLLMLTICAHMGATPKLFCTDSVAQTDSLRHRRHDLALTFGGSGEAQRPATINVGLLGSAPYLRGVQLNAMTSMAMGEIRGAQLATLSNVGNDIRGVQLSAFSNVSLSAFRGVQVGGVINLSHGVEKGIQLSVLANISSSYMRGLQIGAYNYADTLNGSQIGLFNACISHPRGVQIGLVNYSRDTTAHKIGLVNINPKTRIDLMAFGGNSNKINLAVRFRNRSTYSILGFGTHYMGLDKDFSGALYYRLGQYFALSPRWTLSGDVGFFHIETFQHNSANRPDRLYSLQARVNADYQINPTLSAFATLGYGTTRYYDKNREYRTRPIVEVGLALRYGNSTRHTMRTTTNADENGDTTRVYAFYDPDYQHKRPWTAALEVTGLNVLVNRFDCWVLGEDFPKVSLHSIKNNIKTGFVWDNDQFSTNLFAHPYHGGLYFNAARSNGMGFWASVPYSLGGSLMWEFCGETEPPAINDLMATTLGGVAIGEITHRVSALVLDDRTRGFSRFLRELAGTLINPIQGLNRIISGKAWRVCDNYYKYHDYGALPVVFSITAGNRYLADDGAIFRGEHNPYLSLGLAYGDPFDSEQTQPYDYFTASITFGLSANQPLISNVHLLGRLWGVNVYEGNGITSLFGIFQHFNYYDSEPVKDGSQQVPYRISEAASVGPGFIFRFPKAGNMGGMEQRLFLDGILLGGSLSDYYHVIDRDYNMGSGFSLKAQTLMEFPKVGIFTLLADYYTIYTWKGYTQEKLDESNPLYLNAQGDKGSASLLVISPKFNFYLKKGWSLEAGATYYIRDTRYKYRDNVHAQTFEVRLGVTYML